VARYNPDMDEEADDDDDAVLVPSPAEAGAASHPQLSAGSDDEDEAVAAPSAPAPVSAATSRFTTIKAQLAEAIKPASGDWRKTSVISTFSFFGGDPEVGSPAADSPAGAQPFVAPVFQAKALDGALSRPTERLPSHRTFPFFFTEQDLTPGYAVLAGLSPVPSHPLPRCAFPVSLEGKQRAWGGGAVAGCVLILLFCLCRAKGSRFRAFWRQGTEEDATRAWVERRDAVREDFRSKHKSAMRRVRKTSGGRSGGAGQQRPSARQ
jgi:hypothetical protein